MSDHEMSLLLDRLERIETALTFLVRERTTREWYTTEEVAKIVGKAEFTVREWCRNGRIHAEKRMSGRGAFPAWVVSHQELLRYRRATTLFGNYRKHRPGRPLAARNGSREDCLNCLLLHIRVQVPVAAALLIGRMPDEVVDDALINSVAGQSADEAVSEDMPPF